MKEYIEIVTRIQFFSIFISFCQGITTVLKIKRRSLKEISSWFAYTECRHTISVLNTFWQRESDLRIMELFNLGPTAVTSFYNFYLDNLDRVCPGTMASSHIPVALSNSTTHRQVTVFTVHIVSTWSGVVSQPDSKVLNFNRWFFCNLQLGWIDLICALISFSLIK